MVEHLFIWVVGSIPYGGPIELCLVPAVAPRLECRRLWYICCHICRMVHIKDLFVDPQHSEWMLYHQTNSDFMV